MRGADREAEAFYRQLMRGGPRARRADIESELFFRDLVGGAPVRSPRRAPAGGGEAEQAPAPAFPHFGLLEHFWGGDPKSFDEEKQARWGVVLDPSKLDPRFDDTDHSVQAAVDAVLAEPGTGAEIKALRFSIAKIDWHPGGGFAKVAYGGNTLPIPREDEKAVNTGPSALTEPRHTETWEPASLGKFAIMYAAFQLRFDIMAMIERNRREATARKERPWATPAEVQAGVTAAWANRLVRPGGPRVVVRPGHPKLELEGSVVLREGRPISLTLLPGRLRSTRTVSGPPQIDQIFDFVPKPDGTWWVHFKGEYDHDPAGAVRNVWDAAGFDRLRNRLHHHKSTFWAELTPAELAHLSFFDLLWLMIYWSHDHAGSIVLERLGFLYVNSLMWQSGLFDPAGAGGLFLARNYGPDGHWEFWDIKGDGTRGLLVPSQPRFTPDRGGADRISGGISASVGTRFMVLLYRGLLTTGMSSVRMLMLLDRMHGSADRSPLAEAFTVGSANLSDYAPKFEHVYSKIALGGKRTDGKTNSGDAALLYLKHPTAPRTLAATCLDSHDFGPMQQLMKKVADRL
jgi:hypothetical protein